MKATKKVAVKLLVNTAYQGPRKEGDVISVPEDFAARWVKNKIAVYADEQPVNPETTDEDVIVDDAEIIEEPETVEETVNYAEMSAKELFDICQEKGIDVEPKKKKEYYLEKLA